ECRVDLAEQVAGARIPAPPEVVRQGPQLLIRRNDELALGAGAGHRSTDFGGDSTEGVDLGSWKSAGFDRLNHEHALERAAFLDRDARKRPIGFLTGFGKELESWMLASIGNLLRPQVAG